MIRRLFLILALGAFLPAVSAAPAVRVAATHPLLGDLARQVAGDRAQVVDLLKSGGDVHHFEPSPGDLRSIAGTRLVFASGKHLESYLEKLGDSLPGVKIVEVGRNIPSLKMEPGNELFLCCPEHARGGIDPHWWHSPDNMVRAARILSEELTALDPAGRATYEAGAKRASAQIQQLKRWAQQQIARIPKASKPCRFWASPQRKIFRPSTLPLPSP
jgi:zinc/manganese transport system substrate-binding protein